MALSRFVFKAPGGCQRRDRPREYGRAFDFLACKLRTEKRISKISMRMEEWRVEEI